MTLAAAMGEFVQAPWLRWLHFLGMIIYVGGFLTLTRLLGHAVRFETVQARSDAYRVLKRMHRFVDWPGLGIVVITGLIMFIAGNADKAYFKQGYFHVKLTAILAIVITDVFVSRKLFRLEAEGPQPGATPFRIMHGIVGLGTLGALAAVTIVKG
jgi:uncharacterized membrane protein